MKILSIILLVSTYLLSCSSTKQTNILGTWKLTEQRLDIGDGNSTFTKIKSGKTLTFLANGTITSNGAICFMTKTPEVETTGVYDTLSKTLTSKDCPETALKIRYELLDGNLIISYPCMEPCQQKFVKL
jgi:hypothetical protein